MKNETQSEGPEKDHDDIEIKPKMKAGSNIELDKSKDDLKIDHRNGIASSWFEIPITKLEQTNSAESATTAPDIHHNIDEFSSFPNVANFELSNDDFLTDVNAKSQSFVEKSSKIVPEPNFDIWKPSTGFDHFEMLRKVFPERNLNDWTSDGRFNTFSSDHSKIKTQNSMENSRREVLQNAEFWTPNFCDFDNFYSDLKAKRRNFMEEVRKTFPELNLHSDPDWWF